ncbi:MAG: AAA family ATPase [Thaumarchaeota archaeon]|nr:AAA family ATPase [Nitrososphaerota archaeon]
MKTVIIDTVDSLFPQCMAYVCKKKGFEHPSDETHGKGWSFLRSEWEGKIHKILLQGEAVVFVAHSIEREKKKKHQKIDVTQPDLSKTGIDILYERCDIILYLGYDENDNRKLFGMPREDLVIGARGGIVIDGVEPSFNSINKAIKKATGKDFLEIKPTILLYGPPKIGKSTLAASFPNPCVIDMENGYKFLDVKEKHLCTDWSDFLNVCATIFGKPEVAAETTVEPAIIETENNEPKQGEL